MLDFLDFNGFSLILNDFGDFWWILFVGFLRGAPRSFKYSPGLFGCNCWYTFFKGDAFKDAVLKLIRHTESIVVIKSTITPDVINRLYNSIHDVDKQRLTYNPEFLTENNSVEQFIYAPHHIIGGASPEACGKATEFYQMFSMCVSSQFFTMTPQEASFVKYAINSYLGMKVTFFNQLHDAALDFSCSPQRIIDAVSADKRIGYSHTRVPGFDGKKGFGGACLPKDMNAFVKFNQDLTLIAESVKINNKMREEYELDEREKNNNIKFEDK